MRIIHFYSENFKRLKVVEFDPDKNMVVISGKNGHGKSSILDAIWSTFKHAAVKKHIPEPIRHGEGHAKTILTLDGYTVTRTFKGDRSTLRIETNDGTIVKSPQALLDRIVGQLSFDPLEFANAKDVDRRQMIRDVFDLDLAEFDAKDYELKEERKDRNRELKMLDGKLRAIKPPIGGEATDEISAADLIGEMTKISDDKSNFIRRSQRLNEIDKKIKELQGEREKLHQEQITLSAQYGNGNLEIDLTCAWADDTIKGLKDQIDNIESRNARAREIAEYMRIRDLHDNAKADVEKLKSKIELNKIERDEAIEEAQIPIAGLTVEENGIFVNHIPFDQLSQAEKIKASLAIAVAANPELRVIRIVDGSLLDSDNMKLVEEIAEKNDMQIWVERVDDSGKVGIVIEDGEIKTTN